MLIPHHKAKLIELIMGIRENSKLIRGARAVCQDQMAELSILGGLVFFIKSKGGAYV